MRLSLRRSGQAYQHIVWGLLLLAIPLGVEAETVETGSLCVPALPGASARLDPIMLPADQFISSEGTLLVKVDDRPPIEVSSVSGGVVRNLPLKGKHLVSILRNGKQRASFWMNFEKEKEHSLCLKYQAGYGTFSIRSANECDCELPSAIPSPNS